MSTFSMDQVLIELCCLSYSDACPGESISEQQSAISNDITIGLAVAGMSEWSLCWGPALSSDPQRSYMAYIVTDGVGDYAVVIRGTDPCSPSEWFEDADAFLVSAPYGTDVNIANGVLEAITVINGLQDPSSSTTIVGFLGGVDINNLYVTGHSFGGTQATAFAPWLGAQGLTVTANVYAFAATSAGDASFAALYDNNSSLNATLYYNTLDVVPYIWVEIEDVKDMYGNSSGPVCPDAVAAAIDVLHLLGVDALYTDIANQVALDGTLVGSLNWYQELQVQHDHWLYASLLGAPVQSNDDIELTTRMARRKAANGKAA